MSDEAQVSMMLYSGLTSDEEGKLQEIENGVVSHVMNSHGNVRPLWQCVTSDDARSIQLCVPTIAGLVIWQASSEQLATMSSADVLAAIRE